MTRRERSRQRRLLDGRCPDCGRVNRSGKRLCSKCRDRQSWHGKLRRDRRLIDELTGAFK